MIKVENSNWYKNKIFYNERRGSILFKRGYHSTPDTSGWESASGLCYLDRSLRPNEGGKGDRMWYSSARFYFNSKSWEKITNVREVLQVIQEGMKSKGYTNDILIMPIDRNKNNQKYPCVYLYLKDYHFNFTDQEMVNLLMKKGELWLERRKNKNSYNNSIDYICVLKDGELSKKARIRK